MTIVRDLKQALREFLTPESVTFSIGGLNLKYNQALRLDTAKVAALFRSKRVIFTEIGNELWMYVFPSLEELKNSLSLLSGEFHAKGPGDVSSAVDWMVKAITNYLALYQADYTLFMSSNSYPDLAPAHKERNWPKLGSASRDMLELRQLLVKAIESINAYADRGDTVQWEEPWSDKSFWVRYAENRKFCPECGLNLYYSMGETCPNNPSIRHQPADF